MRIGNVALESNAVLAPIAGFSDIGLRYLARKYGAGLTYTEMISAKGLLYGNRQTEQLTALAPLEKPSAVQLFGACPEDMYKAVRLPLLAKFDIIDINMGCPVNKVVRGGEGSALMKTPALAAEMVRAAVEAAAGRAVTVKIRSGWDSVTAPEFAALMQKSGAASVAVHGRLREQFYSGRADWDVIREVKKAVDIPVIGNGDVISAQDYHKMIDETCCDGVMIARGALGNLKIFSDILNREAVVDLRKDIEEHIGLLKGIYPDNVVINLMKAHLVYYTAGKRGARSIRENLAGIRSTEDVLSVADFLSEVRG